jgi:hypothetical protein
MHDSGTDADGQSMRVLGLLAATAAEAPRAMPTLAVSMASGILVNSSEREDLVPSYWPPETHSDPDYTWWNGRSILSHPRAQVETSPFLPVKVDDASNWLKAFKLC